MRLQSLAAAGLLLLQTSSAFYLPGVAPQDYKKVMKTRLASTSGDSAKDLVSDLFPSLAGRQAQLEGQ